MIVVVVSYLVMKLNNFNCPQNHFQTSHYHLFSFGCMSKLNCLLSREGISKSTVLAIEVLFIACSVCWDEARWTAMILLPLLLLTVVCLPPDPSAPHQTVNKNRFGSCVH